MPRKISSKNKQKNIKKTIVKKPKLSGIKNTRQEPITIQETSSEVIIEENSNEVIHNEQPIQQSSIIEQALLTLIQTSQRQADDMSSLKTSIDNLANQLSTTGESGMIVENGTIHKGRMLTDDDRLSFDTFNIQKKREISYKYMVMRLLPRDQEGNTLPDTMSRSEFIMEEDALIFANASYGEGKYVISKIPLIQGYKK